MNWMNLPPPGPGAWWQESHPGSPMWEPPDDLKGNMKPVYSGKIYDKAINNAKAYDIFTNTSTTADQSNITGIYQNRCLRGCRQ